MDLHAFFQPQSVAVIGASDDPAKLGYAVMNNLVEAGFRGPIYPINPKGGTILSHKVYPSVKDVPGPIDLVVVVIPYKAVPAALRECGQKGIPAAVIITAGFREAGREGLDRERELVQIGKEYNIRIIGPNCLGVIDAFTPLNATFAAGTPPSGPIAFMSQSGALGTAILDWALGGRIGFSKFASLGNKADVNEVDLLQAWVDDPNSRVLLAYIEGVPNGQKFIEVARKISKLKPIVAVKSGTTSAGSRAVSSHTGSLAGSEQAYRAAFHQAGVLRAESMEHMFDYALAFGYQPLLPGNRIAIVTNAGGPGILATDALEHAALSVPRLQLETIQNLQAQLPGAASANNPVDVLGDARADRYDMALGHVLADPTVDGVMIIVTPQANTDIPGTAEAVVRHAQANSGKAILGCFMGEVRIQEGVDILTKGGVPNYPFPERAAAAFAAMKTYRELKSQPLPEFEHFDVDQAAVRKLFDQVRSDGRVALGDAEARQVAEAYGLHVPPAQVAATPDEAVQIAGEMGYPVVLKIASPDILHKTDIGGVKLNLQSAGDVRDAFDLIVYRAQRFQPDARIWGCQLQPMVPKGIAEVLVGMSRDPQFGPLVTFGMGGIYVEVLKDVTFRIAPFSRREAVEMLAEIRARALLQGVRGQPPADQDAIVDTLLRVSQLVTDFPEIVEMDINPLVVYERGRGALGLDMRLILAS